MPDQRDLVLSPNQYAYVQDGSTSGNVRVLVGPLVDTLTQNDRLVLWTGRKFIDQPDPAQAKQTFIAATENQYVILTDPAVEGRESFPPVGTATTARSLNVGKRIVIPGPVTFPLWPGQSAEVRDGHRLSNNEYLIAQVYEPTEARENQARAIAESQSGEGEATEAVTPREFTMGERLAIKGTDVSFYIPPTGIEVLQDPTQDGRKFVRQAAVVEQLEYVSLVNEKGKKRIEIGPQVVFPEPDETFETERGERKFRAIELSSQSGLYVKVTANYKHDGNGPIKVWRGNRFEEVEPGGEIQSGDELFLTGADTPIYFPRTEHAVIEYGGSGDSKIKKHYAIAIPAGEGRYVLDRMGDEGVRKVVGPKMLLPDPRTEVVVRRVLEPKTVGLWYPGNAEALAVNQELAVASAAAGEQYLESSTAHTHALAAPGQAGSLARSYPVTKDYAGERLRRGSEYTPTRTITLSTKYEGPPRVSVYPGYAVMVMDPTGNRHVEVGPVDLLLEYHETLMALTLSTGRPKGTGTPLRTVYLRTINNAVGERMTVETRDLVPVTLELSLRVNFEAETDEDRQKWFAIEDYVALLTDHVGSKIRNLAKRYDIQEFYANTADLIRDSLLGEAKEGARRPGLAFEENAMRLYDVEILRVTIESPGVREMLNQAQAQSLSGAITVSQQEEATRRQKRLEELERERIEDRERTAEARSAAAISELERDLTQSLRAIDGQLQEAQNEAKVAELTRTEETASAELEASIQRQKDEVYLARVRGEVDQFVRRAQAVDPKLVDAIRVYGQEKLSREITTAVAPLVLAGVPAVDVLKNQFQGTPLGSVMEALSERPYADALTNGTQE